MSGVIPPSQKRADQQRARWPQRARSIVAALFLVLSTLFCLAAGGSFFQRTFLAPQMEEQSDWVTIRSPDVSDVLEAAKTTSMFQSALTSDDPIGQALQQGIVTTPVLVRPYQSGLDLSPYWVLPIVKQTEPGVMALLVFLYDEPGKRLRGSEFLAVPGQTYYGTHTFPSPEARTIANFVEEQKQVDIRTETIPELIYFPLEQSEGQKPWMGGGSTASDPIWRIISKEQKYYYVDRQNKVFEGHKLPLASGYPAIP